MRILKASLLAMALCGLALLTPVLRAQNAAKNYSPGNELPCTNSHIVI